MKESFVIYSLEIIIAMMILKEKQHRQALIIVNTTNKEQLPYSTRIDAMNIGNSLCNLPGEASFETITIDGESCDNIIKSMNNFVENHNQSSIEVALVYIIGHGHIKSNHQYFLASDGIMDLDKVFMILQKSKSRYVFIIIDICRVIKNNYNDVFEKNNLKNQIYSLSNDNTNIYNRNGTQGKSNNANSFIHNFIFYRNLYYILLFSG